MVTRSSNELDRSLTRYKYFECPPEYVSMLMEVTGDTFRLTQEQVSDADSFEVKLVRTNAEEPIGITIAGYVHDKEEISGIFVKGIADDSLAARDGRIKVHDQIVKVNDHSLENCTNKEAVELLRGAGDVVCLKILRYRTSSRKQSYLKMLAAIEDASAGSELPRPEDSPSKLRTSISAGVAVSSASNSSIFADVENHSSEKFVTPDSATLSSKKSQEMPSSAAKAAGLSDEVFYVGPIPLRIIRNRTSIPVDL